MRPHAHARSSWPANNAFFAIQSNGPGEIFDAVAVHLDTAVGEEELEAVPVAGDIGELLAEAGLGRDAGALLLQPVTEGLDQRRAACLPFGETALGRVAVGPGCRQAHGPDPSGSNAINRLWP